MQFRNYAAEKEHLMGWQKALLPDTKKLILTEEQLRKLSIQKIHCDSEIVDECSDIIRSTVDAKLFFEKLNLFFIHKMSLVSLYAYNKDIKANFPNSVYIAECRIQLIYDFIKRYSNSVTESMKRVKTAKTKCKRWQNFYDSLEPFDSEMDDENIRYYKGIYNYNIQQINLNSK